MCSIGNKQRKPDLRFGNSFREKREEGGKWLNDSYAFVTKQKFLIVAVRL